MKGKEALRGKDGGSCEGGMVGRRGWVGVRKGEAKSSCLRV